ncbi:MAG: hypothetical protein M1817_001059 [Caeruleum heppii]|nr:MAG: hypothetical protein M1817_001059 [Caeruleum heppii]
MALRVLLLGGHGKVSLLMTPQLLARSWDVTSIIRDPAQTDEILKTGDGQPGKVKALVRSLDNVTSHEAAQAVLDEVKPDYVIWSAGAGGKGGPDRTYAIDRDAAKHFIKASIFSQGVTKFVMVSSLSSRRKRAPWWTDEDWALCEKMNNQIIPHYAKAKLEADEYLTALSKRRIDGGDTKFQCIVLRPGGLSDEAATGKISLGRTKVKGMVTRGDVAATAVALLERTDTNGWFDVLNGTENIESAVETAVREKIDSIEGEEVEKIFAIKQ